MAKNSWFVAVVSLLIAGGLQSGAGAHNYPSFEGKTGPCNKSVKWSGASQTYYLASPWAVSIQNGVRNAAASITNGTDFNWTHSFSSPNTVTNLNSSDTSLAGLTSWPGPNCTPTPGIITKAYMYFNLPHFNSGHGTSGSTTWQNYLQCTMIHEFGHGLGLAHNQVSPSMMYATHTPRCHTNSWRTVQPHDVSDINAKY